MLFCLQQLSDIVQFQKNNQKGKHQRSPVSEFGKLQQVVKEQKIKSLNMLKVTTVSMCKARSKKHEVNEYQDK